MRGADAAPGVTVKIFVEQDVVLEVRIGGELGVIFQHGPLTVAAFEEKVCEALRDFIRGVVERDEVSRARRALDLELRAVVVMEFLQRLDEQEIHRQPDRPAPVGVAAKQPALRFRRPVGNFQRIPVALEAIRLLFVRLGKRADAVVAEELRLIQHPAQQAFHAMPAQQREQAAFAGTVFLPARDELGEVGAVVEIPLHPAVERGQFFQQRRIEYFHGEQRNQADERAQFHRHVRAVGQAKMVVIKFVLLVPQTERALAHAIDGGGDVEEVFKKFRRDVLVHFVVPREFQRDAQQVQAIHRHPARAVGLVEITARGQGFAAIKNPNVIKAEEAALENVAALRVLAVHPPGEVEQQLVEDAFEKCQVALVRGIHFAALFAIHLEHAPCRPRMNRRVHVAERPFVRGQLTVGMHVPFARQQHELILRELRVHQHERDGVECQIPRGVPRILPFVRHRNDVGVVEVRPVGVAAFLAAGRRSRLGGIALEPFANVVVKKLLRPDHAGKSLALDVALVGVVNAVLQRAVKLVGFGDARGEGGVEVGEGL